MFFSYICNRRLHYKITLWRVHIVSRKLLTGINICIYAKVTNIERRSRVYGKLKITANEHNKNGLIANRFYSNNIKMLKIKIDFFILSKLHQNSRFQLRGCY